VKKIILSLLLLLTLTGIFATAAHYHHLRKHAPDVPAAPLPAGDAELRKILQRFNGPDSAAEISGTIRIYDGEDSNRLKETSSFCVARSGLKFYCQLSCIQTICNGNILLQIDTVNKTLTIKKLGESGKKMPGLMSSMLPADTTVAGISATVLREHGHWVLRLRNELRPEIRTLSLVYDTVGYRLQKAEIEWWKPGTGIPDNTSHKIWITKIDYCYRQPGPVTIDERIRKVISVRDNKIKRMPLYEDYRLLGDLN
jgi:hypothetical protein